MNCQYLSLKVIWRRFGGYHFVGEWLLSTGKIEDCPVFSKENFFSVPRISRRLFQVTTRSSSEAWPGSRGLWSPLLRTMTTSPFLRCTARWSMWPPMSTSSSPWLGTRSFTQSQSCSFQSFLFSSLSSSLDYWRWSNSHFRFKTIELKETILNVLGCICYKSTIWRWWRWFSDWGVDIKTCLGKTIINLYETE